MKVGDLVKYKCGPRHWEYLGIVVKAKENVAYKVMWYADWSSARRGGVLYHGLWYTHCGALSDDHVEKV